MTKVLFCEGCDMYLNDDGADWKEVIVGKGSASGMPYYVDELCCNACGMSVIEKEELFPTMISILVSGRG